MSPRMGNIEHSLTGGICFGLLKLNVDHACFHGEEANANDGVSRLTTPCLRLQRQQKTQNAVGRPFATQVQETVLQAG